MYQGQHTKFLKKAKRNENEGRGHVHRKSETIVYTKHVQFGIMFYKRLNVVVA